MMRHMDGRQERPARLRPALPAWLRIAIAALLAFLAATAVGGIYLGTRLREIAERSVDERLDGHLAVLSPVVEAALLRDDRDTLSDMAAAAASSGDLRLTIMLPDGEVVAESERPLPLPNHRDRPEMREALARGHGSAVRRSTTVEHDLLYKAARIDTDDGRTVGVLRVAEPLGTIAALDAEVLHVLAIAALLGLPVASVVGWLLARRIAKPLELMTDAAQRMASGDFSELPRGTHDDEAGQLAEALRRMGEKLSATLAATAAERAELSAVLESMVEGVVALDPAERVLHANRGAADCLGLPHVPVSGTPLIEVVRVPEISAPLRAALRGEASVETDVQLPGPAGRVVAISAAPIRYPDGTIRGAVAVLRDVTVMRRLERTRLDFVANVSHELRTPLAAMRSALETAQSLRHGDAADAEDRRRMLDVAVRHVQRLTAIVDDLLALSQIESEGDRLERSTVALLRTIRSAATAVTASGSAGGVPIQLPPPELPEVDVLGHEGRLEEVWVNLLSNAVKYNRPGGAVRVEVTTDSARSEACVAVHDTGRGIPADALPRIFERFYRVDKGRSRDQGGTGLGLAIVKHVVRAHRGRVEVASEPGRGSVFRVWLPLARRA